MSPDYRGRGFTADEVDAMELESLNAQELTFSCFFCAWNLSTTFGEGVQLALAHRIEHHPQTQRRPRYTCHKHDCNRTTQSKTGLCAVHKAETNKNTKERIGARPTRFSLSKTFRGYELNREDLPTWA